MSLVDLPAAGGFMPHGMCYLWQPWILALHVFSDGFIALAYFSIPFALQYFVARRTDLQFNWIFQCFAAFIVACGLTHVMDIWTIWVPLYWLSGGIKAITAAVSVATAVLLIKVIPDALGLPDRSRLMSATQYLQRRVDEQARAESVLRSTNAALEARVSERTAELQALNDTLRRENARFMLAADAAHLGFWSYDPAMDLLQWDERMFRLYGRPAPAGSLPQERWLESVHPEDRARCEREMADSVGGKDTVDTEFRIVLPDGGLRFLHSTARLYRDGGDGAVRLFGVDFDVTEGRLADERFRLAIEAAPTGMLMMNRDGIIVLVNAQIETLFGYPREELLGRRIETLIPERFRAHHPGLRNAYLGSPHARAMGSGRDLWGLRKDGSEVPVEIGLNPLRTWEGDFVLSSIVDISRHREMDRLRSEFVSTVSHELRTPLTSISGALGLLHTGAVGPLPDKAASMVAIAHKNGQRLVRIINDILDIGKLEAGKLEFNLSAVRLSELLQQSIDAHSAYAEKYGVRFLFHDESTGEMAFVDPDRLAQVLANLLSNAAKFSPRGADVLIRMRSDADGLRVEIEDSGEGIPEAFQSRVFEKFSQADASAARRFEGTGLGLAISRQLIEGMGGSIGFSTRVGRGTIFHLIVRRAESAVADRRVQERRSATPPVPAKPPASA